jgi:hypothetical protein
VISMARSEAYSGMVSFLLYYLHISLVRFFIHYLDLYKTLETFEVYWSILDLFKSSAFISSSISVWVE